MPFWVTWFLAGLLTAGVAATTAHPLTNTADTNSPPYVTQNFQQEGHNAQ